MHFRTQLKLLFSQSETGAQRGRAACILIAELHFYRREASQLFPLAGEPLGVHMDERRRTADTTSLQLCSASQ